MRAEKPDAEGGGNSTVRPRSGVRPSAPMPASLSACTGRLLDIATRPLAGATLTSTLERMLDVIALLEPDAAAGLRLVKSGLVLRRGNAVGDATSEQLFPGLDETVEVPLPESIDGDLVFAAPALTQAERDTYDEWLPQAAAVVSLVARSFGELPSVPGAAGASAGRPSARRPIAEGANLVQLEKLAALGQNASEIVHELSNPLTSILAYSDYLVERLRGQGVGQADLDRLLRIHESATRIQGLCRDLSQYARPAGLPLEEVDLHMVIDRALRFCVHGLTGANILVDRAFGEVPLVRGVESSLTQVFVNLITNAWHAMSTTGGTLSLRTEVMGDWVIAEVADGGHGIPLDLIDRVFDPYFSTKPRDHGVGLGLSIVRQILEEHGGRIAADNHDEGGALFRIALPSR
jgi:signal transduction histidine kinase